MSPEQFVTEHFQGLGVPQKEIDEAIAQFRSKFGVAVTAGDMGEDAEAKLNEALMLIHLLRMFHPDGANIIKKIQKDIETRFTKQARMN